MRVSLRRNEFSKSDTAFVLAPTTGVCVTIGVVHNVTTDHFLEKQLRNWCTSIFLDVRIRHMDFQAVVHTINKDVLRILPSFENLTRDRARKWC